MGAPAFETIEHTADKGIRAYGATLEELFANASRGMFSLMADLDRYAPTIDQPVEATGDNLELTLKAWLDELLFDFETMRVLWVAFRMDKVTENLARGTAYGVPFSDTIEWLGAVVKAVTYHHLEVKRTPQGWSATVIFDV